MNVLIIAVLFVAHLSTVEADTCAECGAQYDTDVTGADEANKCKAIKDFLTCLSTATACPLTAAYAGKISTDYTTLSSCTLSDVCTCQKTFFQTDQTADAAAQCGAVTAYFACLRGKTNTACDETTKVSSLATAAVNFIPTECTAKTDTCDCQIEFLKTDMSDDTQKCTAAKNYVSCLVGKTDGGCDTSVDVKTLAGDAKAVTDTGACSTTDVCDCEITYATADIATPVNKCTAVTAYFACLRGKINTACDDTTKVSGLATAAETFIPTECTAKTDTCDCQIEFLKTDMSDDTKKCTGAKKYVSCLVGKTDGGCDTSVDVKTLAGDAKAVTDTEACSTTDVCDCEITYATADIATPEKRCTETKALTSCIQTSINDGCGASTTKTNVGTAAQTVFNDLTNDVCDVTKTCQCQVDFNKADVTSSNKCTAAKAFDTCLNAVDPATDVGCNGTVKAEELIPDMLTKVKDPLCSTAGQGLKSSIVISLLTLMVSALFVSP